MSRMANVITMLPPHMRAGSLTRLHEQKLSGRADEGLYIEEDAMPDQGQAGEASPNATARAVWAHLSAEDLQVLKREVREEVLAELRDGLERLRAERDDARNGRALAEQLLVSLLRQLLPGEQPVYLFSRGVRQLDLYALNPILARYHLRLYSRPSASERQIKTRVGERHWDRRSLFWLQSLPVGENAVPELERRKPLNG
jgi:uncharacterized small protein (DUF1192 family)